MKPSSSRAAQRRQNCIVALVALVARFSLVMWGANRIAPTADGDFYHVIASRMARGLGYTWLWPDGAVTYAAHYPVGYPAIVALGYAVFGAKPVVAMAINAVAGTLAACAVLSLARRVTHPRAAFVVGLLAALHVGLVAYVPALMTEGMTASLWILAAWSVQKARDADDTAAGKRWRWLLMMGVLLGVATLVRPQTLALLPGFAWLAAHPTRGVVHKLRGMAGAAVVCAAVCAPWVVRNQVRMGHASLSFNGGWNLLIGTSQAANGTWAPLEVPAACKLVFHEAKKDICFGEQAMQGIRRDPWSWLKLVPKKLAATFDYCGAAGWYLHASNPNAFPYEWKVRLGAIETLMERLLVVAALVAVGLRAGPRRMVRMGLASAAIFMMFTRHGTWGYVGLVGGLGLFGVKVLRLPVIVGTSAIVLGLTAATHAVFFGAGRYSMVVFPFVTALAGGILTRATGTGDTGLSEEKR